MRNVGKHPKCFMLLSFFLVISALLIWSGVGFAQDDDAVVNDDTIDYTLKGNPAEGKPNCINYGTIDTNLEYEHGMFVEEKDDEGESHYASNFGNVITHGYVAYGMYALDGATATNNSGGMITTHGEEAHGMYALGYYYDEDNDVYYHSTATNNGSIETKGIGAHGMYAGGGAKATNNSGGTITTHGEQAHGMYAYGNSTATNNSEGTIVTHSRWAHGMYAYYYSTSTNSGSIETNDDSANGMYAANNSTVINSGSIETNKADAHGMYAYDNSTATNESEGTITTHGYWAHGMYAANNSTVINSGSIETNGIEAYGMYAYIDSIAKNCGNITTNGSWEAFGIYACNGSEIMNEDEGNIITSGTRAFGMYAWYDSTATNRGTITTGKEDDPTYGARAYGMYAYQDSTAENFGSITTFGETASGMYAWHNSTATNKIEGEIVTYGIGAHGMVASSYWDGSNWNPSGATNEGSIITHGKMAFGINAGHSRNIMNSGDITTYGGMAHGIYVETGPEVINSGTITVTGEGADAVNIRGSTFTNSGTLNSLHGNAVTAKDNSSVILKDETKLINSHILEGDDTSSLDVNMSQDLSAVVKGFGTFTHSGTGAVIFEDGSYLSKFENKSGKTIKIAPNTTFETSSYTQETGASLHVYVPSDPNAGYPLKVSNEGGYAAKFAGNLTIDYSNYLLPGKYNYIYVAGEREGDFDSVSYVNPNKAIYTVYKPQWVKGNSWYYTGLVDYSFSEQALGLVSAIEDWSLLRWIMANHLQDVASEMDNLEAGKKVYYAHFLSSKTDRDPSGGSPLGYESDTRGLSFGFDKKTDEKTVWGIYAGYTEKDIDFTDVAPASADWEEQDSWHIGAYMSKRFDKWIISDTLTYRSTDHDSFRRQKDGDARASFDSWAVTNDIRAGYVVKEIGNDSHWEIVPEVGLNVGYFNRDGYKETNGYTYDDYDTTVTEGVIGVRFKGEFVSKDGSRFSPYLRLSYVNVLSGDDVTIDEIRYGNKSWFTEKLDDDYFAADLGMTLYSAGNFDMSLNYNGRFGDDSESHGGWLRLEWKQ